MISARQIIEYEECKDPFSIPMSDYPAFKRYCESGKKLILSERKTTNDGKKEVIITATSYVGIFIIPGNPALIVQPKIGAISFIQMLRFVDEENIIIQNILAEGIKETTDFVEIFLSYFLRSTYSLLRDHQRRGYNPVSQNLPYLKGQLNFLETINNRAYGSTLVNCRFHCYNMNTILHQTIKFTLLHIRTIVPEKNLPDYLAILQILDKVNITNFMPSDIKRLTFNRLDLHYKGIIDLCQLILRNQIVSLESGELSFPVFCFNSWDIFEKFIRKILQIYSANNHTIVKQIFDTSDERIEPDVVFLNNSTNNVDLVLDAKYKDHWEAGDYYRMKTYIGDLHSPKGVLLYPQKIEHESTTNILYEYFDFEEWQRSKEKYLQRFAEEIKGIIFHK